MTNKKSKKETSFNHQVFEKTYKRVNLSSTDRIIYFRLLGFLIRNDKPFPFSAVKMAELTGLSKRTVFTVLSKLEKLRLIIRIGEGNNRRFKRGSVLNKILTTVQNRSKQKQDINFTTVQLTHQNMNNRAVHAYNKTSSSLKPKEKGFFSIEELQEKAWYLKNPHIPVSKEHKYLFDD